MSPRHRRLRHVAAVFFVILGTAGATGCAARPVPPPVVSKAPVGSIIIYRNGVAYFERHLPPGEEELTLRVPVERVDDFLKSLTILDEKTGETMPVSYPTLDAAGGEVAMTIALPPGHHGLTISYVTESPAWKPSYRLVLGEDGEASLQGWAVVDNVSGEDWKDVRVGVGSTSALSFRYDLHSVHLVERDTLSSGSLVAAAPPTGGPTYASTPKKGKVVADLRQAELADPSPTPQAAPAPSSAVGGMAELPQTGRAAQTARSLAGRLRTSGEKIRIEGFARPDDDDPRLDSLARANVFRNQLIDNGVDPSQVDAVGTGQVDEDQGLRVVALDLEPTPDETSRRGDGAEALPPLPSPAEGEPQGRAHFVSREPMTIEADHSAMVSILAARAPAERVYFYDPISERGSQDFAFNAVKLDNPSDYTLDSGPFTVYANGQFLGEGLTEPILPKATAFIPYALDRNLLVEPEVTSREEISRLVTIQRGIVNTESQRIRRTRLAITNRGTQRAVVYLRHAVAPGFELRRRGPEMPAPDKLDGAHLFRLEIAGGDTTDLVIEEQTPVERRVDLSTEGGIEAIALFLKTSRLDPELKSRLQAIVRRHSSRANLAEKIQTLDEQMSVYRQRIDELNVQLVTLRKLPQGAKLRRHLSDKMEEISERLQEATMRLADMRADLMTERIELADALAELTLKTTEERELASKE